MKTETKTGSAVSIIRVMTAIILCQAAGVIGALFTALAIPNWYMGLAKPWFNPPNWIFAPVWTVLYTLMGVALYLVWEKGLAKKTVRQAMILFLIHLVVNATWSIVFFGFHSIVAAFVNIVILLGLIVAVMGAFYRIDKRAAYLLIPYLIWVSFATMLNFSLGVLNH